MKILIAEDEDFSRTMLQGQLERLGHEVVAVANGNEAWDRLQREEFPLVISDWMMPGIDGLELTRRIRAREHSSYVYVILLTAKSNKKDVIEGIMQGADDFLTKPHDSDELNVRIRAGQRVIDLERRLSARNRELDKAKRKVEQANERMKRDLDAAARIQKSLLPSATPNNEAIDFAWIYQPCDELAGDIFNVFKLDDEHIVFYLLDVVGHGVPAALLSVTLSRIISPQYNEAGRPAADSLSYRLLSPREVATELNQRFPMSDEDGQNFTLLYGCLNVESKELRFVSAGHPGPVYIPANDKPRILEAYGFPIGIAVDPEYEDHRIHLSPGDRFLMYSDGLLDAENRDGSFFGTEGLLKCLDQRVDPLKETIRQLEERVMHWCDGKSPNDDISVLAMSLIGDA